MEKKPFQVFANGVVVDVLRASPPIDDTPPENPTDVKETVELLWNKISLLKEGNDLVAKTKRKNVEIKSDEVWDFVRVPSPARLLQPARPLQPL